MATRLHTTVVVSLGLLLAFGTGLGSIGIQNVATETTAHSEPSSRESIVHSEPASRESVATLVVDADGGGGFTSIQTAINASSSGDTIEVRPGTYEESVTIDQSITLVGETGAKLSGDTDGLPLASGITIRGDAAPAIRGMTISGYLTGINATATTGDWTVEQSTIVDNLWGIRAGRSSGDWTVRNVDATDNYIVGMNASGAESAWTVTNSTFGPSLVGVRASGTSGDWTVADSQFDRATIGVVADRSRGNWALTASEIRDSTIGIRASTGNGDWQVSEVAVDGAVVGVLASYQGGSWSITNATLQDISGQHMIERLDGQPVNYSGVLDTFGGTAIVANRTSGAWRITHSVFTDVERGVNASAAEVQGDATGNWWGQSSGPEPDDCLGNVDCSESLSGLPPGSAPERLVLPGQSEPARTLDTDPLLEDIDGNGVGDIFDALTYYNNRQSAVVQTNPERFDFDGDGTPGTVFDAVALFNEVSG